MPNHKAKFDLGQCVLHKVFAYRGVVVDVDPTFQGSDDWYDEVARSHPPKDKPWYMVLVDGEDHATYVAERHLEPDPSDEPIDHPDLDEYFLHHDGRHFVPRHAVN